MARKMRNPYRVQDQKSLLVRHKPQTRTALGVAPADRRSNRPAMRNATPQPPSANNPRSALGGPAQDVRCSPQPASTGRDSETAPEPHAEAAEPSPPQPKPIPAAVPKAAPNAAPIPTSQPPAPLAPTRCADDSLDPRDAAQGVRSDRPPKASEAANAPQVLQPTGAVSPVPALAKRYRKPRTTPLRVRRQQRPNLRQLRGAGARP